MSRIDLSKAIPLPAPLVLFVEPTNVCNFRCPICPESFADYQEQAGYYSAMTRETWGSIRASLEGWASPVVRFYHVGEPLLNSNLPNMISDAKDLGCRTELTTNAALLSKDWQERLLDSGLDYIRVSVYGTTDAEYDSETGRPSRHLQVLSNVWELRNWRDLINFTTPEIHAELVMSYRDDESRERFLRYWSTVADSCGVKAIHNWGASLVQLGAKPSKQVCPYPFYELAVKANGDVTVCCADWDGKLVVGNVGVESLRDIWHGSRLAELRQVHLSGQRSKLVACRNCNVLEACPDNLDALVPVVAQ